MTASKTPNLGLMNPVATDSFLTTDFADTMQKLDQVPGSLVVPNQASRPSGWSASQHGRLVWQADLNVMWVWHQPTTGSAGAWKRLGGAGLLGNATREASLSTTAISWVNGPNITTVNVMVPGGKPCLVMMNWLYGHNTKSGQFWLNIVENGVNSYRRYFNGKSTSYPDNYPQGGSWFYVRDSASTQQQVNFQIRLTSGDPAEVGSTRGGGTSTVQWFRQYVYEL